MYMHIYQTCFQLVCSERLIGLHQAFHFKVIRRLASAASHRILHHFDCHDLFVPHIKMAIT